MRARALRTEIDNGGDPASAKANQKADALAQPIRTVADLASAYMDACETGGYRPNKKGAQKRPATIQNERWMIAKHIVPAIGSVRVEALTRQGVERALQDIRTSKGGRAGSPKQVMANRVRSLIQAMYGWACATDLTTTNPAAAIRATKETPRARVITDAELVRIWSALKDPSALSIPASKPGGKPSPLQVSRPVRIALQLAFLLLQRRGEIAGMRLDELDLDAGRWTLRAERTKNGNAHVVPLSPYATGLIREAIEIANRDRGDDETRSPFVFPGRNSPMTTAIDPGAMSHALSDIRAAVGVPDVTTHDARRLGASLLCGPRIGVSPWIASLILNHSGERGGAAAVTLSTYVHSDMTPETRRALEALERLLRQIVGEVEADTNVVAMIGASAA
ncbi:MAG: hypothetical protein EON96_12965 [Caulobacteraceae bacterium]|nr:MAG: hypothetical protein EON96_12965 [Caulobacteraceae bacterium]